MVCIILNLFTESQCEKCHALNSIVTERIPNDEKINKMCMAFAVKLKKCIWNLPKSTAEEIFLCLNKIVNKYIKKFSIKKKVVNLQFFAEHIQLYKL